MTIKLRLGLREVVCVINKMRGVSACVVILLCFVEVISLNKENVPERFSKVRFLVVQKNISSTTRPLFYWEPSPITSTLKYKHFPELTPLIPNPHNTDLKDQIHSIKQKKKNRKGKSKMLREEKLKKLKKNNMNNNEVPIKPKNYVKLNPQNKNFLNVNNTKKGRHIVKKKNFKNVQASSLNKIDVNSIKTYDYKSGKAVLTIPLKSDYSKSFIRKSSEIIPTTIRTTSFITGTITTSSSTKSMSTTTSGTTPTPTLSTTINSTPALSTIANSTPTLSTTSTITTISTSPTTTTTATTISESFRNHTLEKKNIDISKSANNLSMQTASITETTTNKPSYTKEYSNISNSYNDTKFRCDINNGGCSHFCSELRDEPCFCLKGYELRTDKKSCNDIDECLNNNGGCEYKCFNTPGSFYCTCPIGFQLEFGAKTCVDLNECNLRNGHGPCQDTCTNTRGSYICSCSNLKGTRLSTNKHNCEDINECEEGESGCSHGCINAVGKAFCDCPEGMRLGKDHKTCQDINECENREIRKKCHRCENTPGSYICLQESIVQNDRAVPPKSCPIRKPPLHGFFRCSNKQSIKNTFKIKRERMRATNSPGTSCVLICLSGYRTSERYRIVCNEKGFWTVNESVAKCEPITAPKIKCPPPIEAVLTSTENTTRVVFPAPKANVNWKHVESDPISAKTNLEAHLPFGYHWITFKATDPITKRSARCLIYIVVKKSVV